MADVLAMSENAATLAQQIGNYLTTQGSTVEMKALGANISATASKMSTEIQARRTRKAPAKSLLPPGESAVSFLVKKQQEATAAAKKIAEATAKKAIENATAAATDSALSAANRASKGVFGRLMGTLKPTTQKEQPKGPISVAQAFEGTPYVSSKKGGYRRRTRRVARKNFA